MKTCPKCKIETDDFHKGTGSDGLQSWCKTCNKDRLRVRWLAQHGLTPEQYEDLLERQDYGCAVCTEVAAERCLDIDHDHLCCPGKFSCGNCVRGLLCRNCNNAIGLLQENSQMVTKAATYLAAYEGRQQKCLS